MTHFFFLYISLNPTNLFIVQCVYLAHWRMTSFVRKARWKQKFFWMKWNLSVEWSGAADCLLRYWWRIQSKGMQRLQRKSRVPETCETLEHLIHGGGVCTGAGGKSISFFLNDSERGHPATGCKNPQPVWEENRLVCIVCKISLCFSLSLLPSLFSLCFLHTIRT